MGYPITRRQILDSSKLTEFADNNFKLDENGMNLSKQVGNAVGKGEIACYEAISPFPRVFSKGFLSRGVKRCHCVGMVYPITRQQILDSSKLKEFADDNFKLDKNGINLSKQVENTVGKGEIACYEYMSYTAHCW